MRYHVGFYFHLLSVSSINCQSLFSSVFGFSCCNYNSVYSFIPTVMAVVIIVIITAAVCKTTQPKTASDIPSIPICIASYNYRSVHWPSKITFTYLYRHDHKYTWIECQCSWLRLSVHLWIVAAYSLYGDLTHKSFLLLHKLRSWIGNLASSMKIFWMIATNNHQGVYCTWG